MTLIEIDRKIEDKIYPNNTNIKPLMYSRKLDSMYIAELWMIENDWDTYLNVYIRKHMDCYPQNGISATALERANAFIKTYNL